MRGSPKRAPNSPRPSKKAAVVLDLPTVHKMLPLVRRIVGDLLAAEQQLGALMWEQESLDDNRRTLTWPQRQRRYFVQDEISRVKDARRDLEDELEQIGVKLTDSVHGRVGFPTIVNAKPAFFTWQHGEAEIGFWHFADDADRLRPIPTAWLQGNPAGNVKKKRSSEL